MKADNPIYKRTEMVGLAIARRSFLSLPREDQQKVRSMIELFDLELQDDISELGITVEQLPQSIKNIEAQLQSDNYPRELVDELVSHYGKEGAKKRLREMRDLLEQSKLTKKINNAWKEKFGIK